MPHDVFISYASKDKSVADAACATLEARKLRCWIAPRDVLPGMNYAEAIVDAINESRVMVLVFSAQANTSKHVMREVERAVHRGLPIIPFRIEDTVPSKAMEYFISAPHWLDALSPPLEKHLARLADTALMLARQSEQAAALPAEPASDAVASKSGAPAQTNGVRAEASGALTQTGGATSVASSRPARRSSVRTYMLGAAALCLAAVAFYLARSSTVNVAGASGATDHASTPISTAPLAQPSLDATDSRASALDGSRAQSAEVASAGAATQSHDVPASDSEANGVHALGSTSLGPHSSASKPKVESTSRTEAWPSATDLAPDAAIWSGTWREGSRTGTCLFELPPSFSSASIANAPDATLHARAACFPEFPSGVMLEGRASGKSVTWRGPVLLLGETALEISSTLDGSVLKGTWTRGARTGSFEASLNGGRTDLVRTSSVWIGRMGEAKSTRECALVLRNEDGRRVDGDFFLLDRGPTPHSFHGFLAADNLWIEIDPAASELAGRTLQLKLAGESLGGAWIEREDSGDAQLELQHEAPTLAAGSVWKGTYGADRKTCHVLVKLEKANADHFTALLYFPEESSTSSEVKGRLIGDRMLLAAEFPGELKSFTSFTGVLSKSGIDGKWFPSETERTTQLTLDSFRAVNFESGSTWKGNVHTTGKFLPASFQVKSRTNTGITAVIEFEGKGQRQTKPVTLEGNLVGSTLALVMSATGTDWDGARVWAEVRPRWITGKWVTKGSEGELRFELQ